MTTNTQKRVIDDVAKKRLTEKFLSEFEQHIALVQDDIHMLYLLGHDVESEIEETSSIAMHVLSMCRTGKSVV
jgi:hypothetical protein